MRTIRRLLILGAHLALGAVLLLCLARKLQERRAEGEELRRIANEEHAATERLQRQVLTQEAQLEGLRRDDPYVIELMARSRHGWEGVYEDAVEVSPPPLPSEDKPSP